MLKSEPTISALIEDFTNQIVAAVNAAAAQRIQAALAGAFDGSQDIAPVISAQPAAAARATAGAGKRSRPKQLCPVPGCNNVAAPVFGMVCSEHKGVAKSKIAKYRAERKATAGSVVVATSGAAPKAKKTSPKMALARKLQGQYLGALRGLSEASRVKVRQLAAEKGVADAVKVALALKKAGK